MIVSVSQVIQVCNCVNFHKGCKFVALAAGDQPESCKVTQVIVHPRRAQREDRATPYHKAVDNDEPQPSSEPATTSGKLLFTEEQWLAR
ncbi:hypothetical protein GUJ93_ZPchr2154g29143 [Zizania palustris]|uniref:Uncharacterized protein n=1 Tax=Zizania palustris TaxID=103762 RepID=A0A8J5T7W0_ZIZPA|nr:hypothetical protein GUJ93_ZPchr2154g29143 [Zizania palustris]